jgi:hypothetical protein
LVRKNIWSLSTVANPWHPNVLAYAKAVRAMQALPDTKPTSWRYQAAIHGRANAVPPAGAPWNECQHATWYFLPWHRMYLYQFERIVRSFVRAAGGPANWTLPYWDYSSGAPGNALPPAFRAQTLPDNTSNPLFVARRRASVNAGRPLPAAIVNTSVALAKTEFTNQGAATGFGGPQTGFAHQGPAFGAIEAEPHGPVHVQVGGPGGLMTDPDLAALDPIFWLHHANIDRLWDVWRLRHSTNVNPTAQTWLNRRFKLRNAAGTSVSTMVKDVVDDIAQLDYTYDGLPAQAALAEEGEGVQVPRRKKPVMIGRNDRGVALTTAGASAEVAVGPLPQPRAAAGATTSPRLYLDLADIEGSRNPGVVFGVYLNLPKGADPEGRDEYLAGVVSFFGIEQAGATAAVPKGRDAHPIHYSFDITEVVDRLRSKGTWDPDTVRVELLPIEGSEEPEPAAAAAPATVKVGTISLFAG